jgi:hypothetical protein
MSSHNSIYTVKKSLKKKLHTKNILDIYFSIYSMKIFVEYVTSYIVNTIIDNIPSNIKAPNKNIFTRTLVQYKDNIQKSIIYWLLYEKYKSSKLSFFPKINNVENVSYIISSAIYMILVETLKINITSKKVDSIIKKIHTQIDTKKIISYLHTHHTPNLFDDCAYKKYSVIEKSIPKEKGSIYKLYKKGSIENVIPIEFTFTGYSIHNTNFIKTPVVMPITYTLTSIQKKILQKRYTGPKEQFEKAIYTLLLYYSMYFESETLHIPTIKNKTINTLYKNSVELLGTPLSIPLHMEYCGMFPEIEMYFGSKGSFFSCDIQSGTYSLYLPNNSFICEFVFDSMYKWLNEKKNVTCIVWIPSIYKPDKNKYYKYKTSYTNTELLRKRDVYVYSNE